MFHHVTNTPEIYKSNCLLSTDRFYSLLNKYSCFATIYEVLKFPSKKKIAITFDDSLADLYTIAYPILKEKEIPFTAFIIANCIDIPGYITTQQLKALSENPLVTIGSHGSTHEVLAGLSAEEQRAELFYSQEKLHKITGKAIDLFAYSHGKFDSTTLRIASQYRYCFSTAARPLNFITGYDHKKIPRISVQNETFDNVISLLKQTLGV